MRLLKKPCSTVGRQAISLPHDEELVWGRLIACQPLFSNLRMPVGSALVGKVPL
jgi:hypothetical protein